MHVPTSNAPARVEAKVTWAALGSFGASLAVAILNAAAGNSELLGAMPPWLQFVIITFGPVLITFLSGYTARSKTSTVSDGYRSAA